MVIGYQCMSDKRPGSKPRWATIGVDLPENTGRNVFKPVVFVVETSTASGIFTSRLVRRSYRRTRFLLSGFSFPKLSHVWDRTWTLQLAPSTPNGYELLQGTNREAVAFLPPEIVCIIAEYSHYDDLISLSQSAWALRTMFFGEADPQARLRALRKLTCAGETSSCTVCHAQICPVSARTTAILPQLTDLYAQSCARDDKEIGISKPLRHLNGCQPQCSSCYWVLRCGPKRRTTSFPSYEHGRYLCHVTAPYGSITGLLPDLEPTLPHSERFMPYEIPRARPKSTCMRCSTLPLPIRRKKMEARDVKGARHAWKSDMQCKACGTRLEKMALRWWVCSWCGGDCPDGMHPLTGLWNR